MAAPTVNGSATTNQGSGSSILADLPDDIVDGELLILLVSMALATGGAVSATGWDAVPSTAVFDGNGGNQIAALKRVADGTEGASISVALGGTADSSSVIALRIGNDDGIADSDNGSATSGATTAITSPSVDAAANDSLLIRAGCSRQQTSIANPASHTNIALVTQGSGATDTTMRACSKVVASGATGTADFVGSGSDREWCAISIVISPAPGPSISDQPDPATVYEGQTANFSIVASGTGTLHYQWKFDGSNVGSDQDSYARTNCVFADNGKNVTCDVTDDNGTTVSDNALLTVLIAAKLAWIRA